MNGTLDKSDRPNRADLAQYALSISQEMLRATETDGWDDLTVLDEERERVIAELFDGLEAGDPDNATWEWMVWEIQKINDEVLDRVLAERSRIAREIARFRNGKKAHAAYAQQAFSVSE